MYKNHKLIILQPVFPKSERQKDDRISKDKGSWKIKTLTSCQLISERWIRKKRCDLVYNIAL